MELRNNKFILIIIGILSIIVVFFVPFGIHVDLGADVTSIIATSWEVPLNPTFYSIRFFSALQFFVEYCFFRFFFLLAVYLFYIGKFNKIHFILVGIISELIPLILSIPASFILNSDGDNLFPIIWPLPFLLIFDLIVVKLVKYIHELNSSNECL